MTRFNIPSIIPWLLLVIPINIYVIGDWLGAGVQWSLFRYQQTYLGSNLILINQDIQYILDGFISGKTTLSVLFWITAVIFLFLILLVSDSHQGKSGIRHTGILCIL